MRIVALLVALVAAAASSQAPEFAQQYRQRMDGALDELASVIQNFNEDATRYGYNPAQALAVMADNNQQLVREQSLRVAEMIVRYARLEDRRQAFDHGGPFVRVAALLKDYDPTLTLATARAFAPAVPTTPEDIGCAAIGFAAVYLLLRLLGIVFLPRRRRRHAVADEAWD